MATTETFEQATVRLDEAKATRKAANEAMETFRKANSIKKNTPSEEVTDKALNKEYKGLMKAQKEARAAVEDAETAVKALKPKSSRVTTYEYPEDCTTPEQKKKFRAKSRAEAKRADKPAKEPKADKPAKKAKTEEAPAEAPAKKKKAAKTED